MGIVFGVVVYAAILVWSDAGKLVGELKRFPVAVFLGALGLTLINYALRFAKWHWYLKHLDIEVPVWESAQLFVAGMVMSVTPGKVGEVLKSFLLRESRGVAAARTAPVVVAERVTDLLGMVVIAGFGVVTFEFGRAIFATVVLGLALLVVVLNQRHWVQTLLERTEDVPVLGAARPKLEEAYESMHSLVQWRILGGTTLLSVLAWSMEGLAMWWIVWAIAPEAPSIYLIFFIYSMGTILGSVSFLPGGLGVAEFTMIAALTKFGVLADEPAAVVTYLIRFATLWFGVGLGLLALIRYRVAYIGTPSGADMEEDR